MSGRGRVNSPITLGCAVMIIITIINGTADDTVDDRGPEQRLDRIDMNEIDADADQRAADDRRIELLLASRA